MNEFQLIDHYFKAAAKHMRAQGVKLGIGDDCALVQVPRGKTLAVSVDTLVSGVHFPEKASAEDIAQRALRVNLSDLAAMGASPLWFTLALTLPKELNGSRDDWIAHFSHGLFACAREFNIALIGGDTTSGPLSISLQVMGQLTEELAFKRHQAKVGDLIYVTHCLGDGAAALELIQHPSLVIKLSEVEKNYLLQRFYKPQPRFKEAQLISGLSKCAMDISDGLVGDLQHICEASGVGAEIQVEQLPISEATLKLQGLEKARLSALSGGDDYELCFVVQPQQILAVNRLVETGKLNATCIGKIIKGDKVNCFLNHENFVLAKKGYDHFS